MPANNRKRRIKWRVVRFINRHIAKIVFIGLPVLGMVIGIFIGMKVADHNHSKTMNDYGRDMAYVSYKVQSGDTLWTIASDLAPLNPEYNDVRQYIKAIEDINGIYGDNIHTGNYILIPYYKDPAGTDAVYEKYGIQK